MRREAQQVANCLDTKPDIEDLVLDKKAWAAALRDYVKIPGRMIGELKHHSLMLLAPNSLAPNFIAERFQYASRNIYRSMAADTTRTMSGTAEVDRAQADPVAALSHSARRRQQTQEGWREAWRRILEDPPEVSSTTEELIDLLIEHNPRLEDVKRRSTTTKTAGANFSNFLKHTPNLIFSKENADGEVVEKILIEKMEATDITLQFPLRDEP